MNSISRRKFLKISGATVVTAAALAGSAKTIVNAAESYSKPKDYRSFRATVIYVFGNAAYLLM